MAFVEWGHFFGLHPSDLTIEQLKKIKFGKLVEFLDQDSRVESILCELIQTVAASELCVLKECKNTPTVYTNFVAAYNQRLKNLTSKELKKSGYGNYDMYRGDYIFWELLNQENKLKEIVLWSQGKDSIISRDNVDYKWLYEYQFAMAQEIVNNVINGDRGGYYKDLVIGKIIRSVPKDELLRIIPILKEKDDKDSFVHVLSNENTPEESIIEGLRIIAKRVGSPPIRVKIQESTLRSLPPVTRLEALENIVRHLRINNNEDDSNPLRDINESTIRELLFSSVMKHPARVESLIKDMKSRRIIQ